MVNRKPIQYFLLLLILSLYLLIGFRLYRHETTLLLTSYGILFGLYCWIIFSATNDQVSFWFYAAIIFRSALLFSTPTLSDDFYRFIWDGRLLASGYHPFAHVPSFYIENNISIPGIDKDLFLNLNSKNYFTIYPRASQLIFWLAAKSSSSLYGSLVTLKVIILFFEIVSIVLIKKLLGHFKLSAKRVIIYALNPLVIIELTGSAHLEGIMIFFLLLTLYLFVKSKIISAASALAVSICVKLIPLIFLPALLPILGWKRTMLFYGAALISCAILSIPLWDVNILAGYQNSLGYYFSRFEFNASIYYVVRELGFLFFGYNIIQVSGWILASVAAILILIISVRQQPMVFGTSVRKPENESSENSVSKYIHMIMWCLVIYFLFTTTLHPWYIITLLAISVFTDFRFVVLWTGTIFLTYAGYSVETFEENLWLVAFEYAAVLAFLFYELRKKNNTIHPLDGSMGFEIDVLGKGYKRID